MNRDYLIPFLNHLSLKLPSNVVYNNTIRAIVDKNTHIGGKAISQVQSKQNQMIKPKGLIGGAQGDEEKKQQLTLATMISKAIIAGFNISKERVKKDKLDEDNIKKMLTTNNIDIEYGGGLLIFGTDLQIKKMIHMFQLKNESNKYFVKEIDANIENDVILEGIHDSNEFDSSIIVQEILNICSVDEE